jgi:hypothetical protein
MLQAMVSNVPLNLQVAQLVVQLIAVEMMDLLSRKKSSS